MTDLDERLFRRLLRWYPRAWRRRHGDVMLSTLLDAAGADGRLAPTAAEARRAVLHGTAAHVGLRFALVTSLSAVTAAVVVGILWAMGTAGDLSVILLAGVIPALASASIVASARLRGLASDGEALVILTTASAAWALNASASLAWSQGFDAADDGRPVVGLAAAWVPLVAVAGVVGAVALGLAVSTLLRGATRWGIFARSAIGGAVGFVLAPVLGVTTVSPASAAVMAGGAVIVVVLPRRRAADRSGRIVSAEDAGGVASVVPRPPVVLDPRRRAASRALAWVATAGGTVGVVYALTGAMWSPGAGDGTVAMVHGITLLLVSTLPLLGAFGLSRVQASTRTAGVHRWGPLTLLASAVSSVALAYGEAPDSSATQPGMSAGALLLGGALAWVIAMRARLPRQAAVTVGVVIGVLFASFLGVVIVPMLVFGVPIAGAVLAVRAGGPPASPGAVSSGAPAPVW